MAKSYPNSGVIRWKTRITRLITRTEVEWLKVAEPRRPYGIRVQDGRSFQVDERDYQCLQRKRFPAQKPGIQALENIETLTKMGLEGNTVEVLFNPRDKHVQRDLIVRWGIDVGYATRVPFKVSHYSHMNNSLGSWTATQTPRSFLDCS